MTEVEIKGRSVLFRGYSALAVVKSEDIPLRVVNVREENYPDVLGLSADKLANLIVRTYMEIADDYIQVVKRPNAALITIVPEKILDDEVIAEIERGIKAQVEQVKTPNFVLDFSNVRFLTSSFLGYLIRLSKMIYEKEGQLRLCSIDDNIRGIFKITRLDKILDIHADAEKALLSIGENL